MIFSLLNGGDVRGTLISMLLSLPIILLSLSFHEFGHAFVADRCGDPTARYLGRCTLNPLKHLDPMGFMMMFLLGFGYAKPVPVNPRNFRRPRRDDLLVSLAGVTCNMILALIGAALMMVFVFFMDVRPHPLFQTAWMGMLYIMVVRLITINLTLTVFNLLPVPPLDGYHVFNDLLFGRRLFAPELASRIGMGVLLILIMTGLLDKGLSFVINHTMNGIMILMIHIFRALGMV